MTELWRQLGDWKTLDAQKRYMKSDKERLLSVSRVVMRLLTGLAPDVRTECGSAVAPPLAAGDDAPPDVVGVPKGAFAWSLKQVERLLEVSSRRPRSRPPPIL